MALDRIDAEPDHFGATISELFLETSDSTKFGGADWGEVFGVREENSPIVPNPLVEADWALGRFRCEIWSDVVDAKSHDQYLSLFIPFVPRWVMSTQTTGYCALFHCY
jgi:hypothetical protein